MSTALSIELLCILILSFARRVLDGENNDLAGTSVQTIIDQIRIFSGHELAHAFNCLTPTGLRKQHKILQRIKDGGAYTQRSIWITLTDIIGNIDQVLRRSRREAKLHRSKRRNAASTSASLANSR